MQLLQVVHNRLPAGTLKEWSKWCMEVKVRVEFIGKIASSSSGALTLGGIKKTQEEMEEAFVRMLIWENWQKQKVAFYRDCQKLL